METATTTANAAASTLRYSGALEPVPLDQDRCGSDGAERTEQVFNDVVVEAVEVPHDERPVSLVKLPRQAEVLGEEPVAQESAEVLDKPAAAARPQQLVVDADYEPFKDRELLGRLPGVELLADGSFLLRPGFEADKLGESQLQAMSRLFVYLLTRQDSSSLLPASKLVHLRLGELLEALPQLYRERLQSELTEAAAQQTVMTKAVDDLDSLLQKPFEAINHAEQEWTVACRKVFMLWAATQLDLWKRLGADPKALSEAVNAAHEELDSLTKDWGPVGLSAAVDGLKDFVAESQRSLSGLHCEGCTVKQLVELRLGAKLEGLLAAERFYDYALQHRIRDTLNHEGDNEGSVWDSFPRNSEYHHLLDDLSKLYADEERFKARRSPADVEAYDLTRSAIDDAVGRYMQLWQQARSLARQELQAGDSSFRELLMAYGDSIHQHVAAQHARAYYHANSRASKSCKQVMAKEALTADEGGRAAEERIKAWYSQASEGAKLHTLDYRMSALREIKEIIKPGMFAYYNVPQDLLNYVNTWQLKRARNRAHSAVSKLQRRYGSNPAVGTANRQVLQLRRPMAMRSQEVELDPRFAERVRVYGQGWRQH